MTTVFVSLPNIYAFLDYYAHIILFPTRGGNITIGNDRYWFWKIPYSSRWIVYYDLNRCSRYIYIYLNKAFSSPRIAAYIPHFQNTFSIYKIRCARAPIRREKRIILKNFWSKKRKFFFFYPRIIIHRCEKQIASCPRPASAQDVVGWGNLILFLFYHITIVFTVHSETVERVTCCVLKTFRCNPLKCFYTNTHEYRVRGENDEAADEKGEKSVFFVRKLFKSRPLIVYTYACNEAICVGLSSVWFVETYLTLSTLLLIDVVGRGKKGSGYNV